MSAAVSRSCAVATLVVSALWLAGTAHAQGADWPAPLPAQASAQEATAEQGAIAAVDATDAQPAPQASAQDSGTTQAAATSATATRPQPTNVVVSVRVNSPGDDGPVTQSSTVAVAAQSKNTAATAQTAHQAQDGAADAAPAPTEAAAPQAAAPPAPGAVAERPAEASSPASAPASCVSVAPGAAATRIVITIGKSCRHLRRVAA